MDIMGWHFSMYVIPPLLSLITGWTIALISIVKGKFRKENILFSLICIWWTLMPVIYISHHLFRGNISLILHIERSIHFIYVYMPFIIFLYLEASFGLKKKYLLIIALIQSIVISAFVPTKYYISGLYTYKWGYTAIGGIAFQIFGASAMVYTIYAIYFFVMEIRRVETVTQRLKLKYIISSFIVTAILMILNMPSIIGIDFYAFGNFMFVPLLLMAYGVLRYRLMEIKSVLHITFVWLIISSLIIIPNILIYHFVRPYFYEPGDRTPVPILIAWFLVNYYYFVKIKPVIDRLFNKQKFSLIKNETKFIESVSLLKTIDELTELFSDTLRKNLYFRDGTLYLRTDDELRFTDTAGKHLYLESGLHNWLLTAESLIDRELVMADPQYSQISNRLLELFKSGDCDYIMPFVYNNELTGMAVIGERVNMKTLSGNEIRFLNSIRNALSISISNSVMYQNLSDLKDTLEDKVVKRTEELLDAMGKVEEVNRELTVKNNELNEARHIAEKDMLMAVNVQKSIFPSIPENDPEWDIAATVKPMSGVSGDLYDIYVDDDRISGLILLDVSGHGIASGLITMIARSVFHRNFFLHREKPLGRIMNAANSELIREISNSEKYLTGILLRMQEDIVEYVNAGHPDILIRRKKSGVVSSINSAIDEPKGGILGISDMDLHFQTLKFSPNAGDAIVAFSDGIIEAISPSGRRYGIRNLEQALHGSPGNSAQEILEYIMNSLYSFTGTDKLNDDLTIAVLVKK